MADTIAEAVGELSRLRYENERLRAFALELLEYMSDDRGMDLDGGDVQGMCEKHGLLVRIDAVVPCSVWCECAEVLDTGDKAECYRTADWLRGAVQT